MLPFIVAMKHTAYIFSFKLTATLCGTFCNPNFADEETEVVRDSEISQGFLAGIKILPSSDPRG